MIDKMFLFTILCVTALIIFIYFLYKSFLIYQKLQEFLKERLSEDDYKSSFKNKTIILDNLNRKDYDVYLKYKNPSILDMINFEGDLI